MRRKTARAAASASVPRVHVSAPPLPPSDLSVTKVEVFLFFFSFLKSAKPLTGMGCETFFPGGPVCSLRRAGVSSRSWESGGHRAAVERVENNTEERTSSGPDRERAGNFQTTVPPPTPTPPDTTTCLD